MIIYFFRWSKSWSGVSFWMASCPLGSWVESFSWLLWIPCCFPASLIVVGIIMIIVKDASHHASRLGGWCSIQTRSPGSNSNCPLLPGCGHDEWTPHTSGWVWLRICCRTGRDRRKLWIVIPATSFFPNIGNKGGSQSYRIPNGPSPLT